MTVTRFDTFARSWGHGSRRDGLRLLAIGALSGLLFPLSANDSAAKRRRKKKRKKKKQKPLPPPTFNAFGCLDVGLPCRGDSTLCCSGICQGAPPAPGQPDTSVCVAHNVGICQAGQDSCLEVLFDCGFQAFCTITTGNAPFCAGIGQCRRCAKDTDCVAEFGPGAACIVCPSSCPVEVTQCNAAGA